MSKKVDLRIAATSRSRTKIAAQIAASFYHQIQGPTSSRVSLVMGNSDSELGGISSPIVVGKEKYHFSFANPAGLGRMALLGRGFYRDKIFLRAIGVFPSWDRLTFAVHKETGIRSLEEIKDKRYPLRVSCRRGGKLHATLFAIEEVLKGYGFSLADIEKWGGKIFRASNPSGRERAEHIQSGDANAVFDEGLKSWGSLALKSGMRFLSIKDDVLKRMEKIGLSRAEVGPVRYPELDREISTLDFSGWLFFCHRDLSSRIAYDMAMAIDLCHSSIPADHFDRRGTTMEEFCHGGEGGPLTIPLHPGAKKYYHEKGYL